jgi:hypothetical protein
MISRTVTGFKAQVMFSNAAIPEEGIREFRATSHQDIIEIKINFLQALIIICRSTE